MRQMTAHKQSPSYRLDSEGQADRIHGMGPTFTWLTGDLIIVGAAYVSKLRMLSLTTGQKLNNSSPDSDIEVLKVRH